MAAFFIRFEYSVMPDRYDEGRPLSQAVLTYAPAPWHFLNFLPDPQ